MPNFLAAAEVRAPKACGIAALVPSRWIVTMKRAIPTFVILIALSQTATAGVPLFGHVSCGVVRFYVARYSEAAAEKWARNHGAGDAEIETARRCLHGANVQTASSAAKSQVLAQATAQERAQHEPAERNPDQVVLRVEPEQAQHADPEQDNHDNKPSIDGLIRPKDTADRLAEPVRYEIKAPAPSDGRTATSRPRVMHRADSARVTGQTKWLKRLWDRLTSGRQFRIAFLHFSGSRR
jgi:hypothetical protein